MIGAIRFFLNLTAERRKVYRVVELKPAKDGKLNDCGEPYKIKRASFHKGAYANPCYSVSKSVSAIILGMLFDKGLVKPEDKIADILGEYFPKDVDEKWYSVTVEHALRHRTGKLLDCDLDFDSRMTNEPEDFLNLIFSCKLTGTPGKEFLYSDLNYYLVCRVIEKIAGEPAHQIARRELFYPMKFCSCSWSTDKYNHTYGGTGLYLRTEDLAKLGWLFLNKGVWNGKRIVSEEWINKMIDVVPSERSNYGYGIRRVGKNTYNVTGCKGQCCMFNYSTKQVVAWQSHQNNLLINFVSLINLIKR